MQKVRAERMSEVASTGGHAGEAWYIASEMIITTIDERLTRSFGAAAL